MGEVVIPLESLGTFLWLAEYLELNLAPEEKDGWVPLEQQRNSKKTTTVSGEIQIRARFLEAGQVGISTDETVEEQTSSESGVSAAREVQSSAEADIPQTPKEDLLEPQTQGSAQPDSQKEAKNLVKEAESEPRAVAPVDVAPLAERSADTPKRGDKLELKILAGRDLAAKDSNGNSCRSPILRPL